MILPRILVTATILTLLTGCAASPAQAVVQHLTGGKVDGGRDRAVVHGMDSTADAFPLAVVHCTRFGRQAQFVRSERGAHIFACVD